MIINVIVFSVDFREFRLFSRTNSLKACCSSFCRKNDSQFDRKTELEAMKKESE